MTLKVKILQSLVNNFGMRYEKYLIQIFDQWSKLNTKPKIQILK